jgi:hypothetical protein
MIFPEEGGATLGGIIYLSETRVFKEFQFEHGTLYFRVLNTDPTNPSCQNWNLSGYVSFLDENTLDMRISGNECGFVGSEYVDWGGSLTKKPSGQDSLYYFSFGKSGNQWVYKVIKKNTDSCQLTKLLAVKSGNYIFTGETTHGCNWPSQNIPLNWSISPAAFTVENDVTLSAHPVTIPVYAKKGAIYPTVINSDTVTVTLLNTNQLITNAAGSFYCSQFQFTEPVLDTTGQRYQRITQIWLHQRQGIILQQVLNPARNTDPESMMLVSKNF